MRTREEALTLTPLETVKDIINTLYDEFGECQKCEFIGERGVYCNKHGFYVPKKGTCWEFKKGINDNSTKAERSKR